MAVMSPNALLTKRSKPILALSLVKPLRILLPRTRFLRHRIETASSSRGDGPPVWCKSSSLASGPSLAIWLRPYHQAPTSVGASFLRHCSVRPAIHLHANLHGSTSDCAFVPQPPISDIAINGGLRGEPASSKVSGSGQRPNGPAHPLGRGLFVPQDLRANGTSCPAHFSPDTHSSKKSIENNGLSPARHLQPRTRRPGDSHGCHHLDIRLRRLSGLWHGQ